MLTFMLLLYIAAYTRLRQTRDRPSQSYVLYSVSSESMICAGRQFGHTRVIPDAFGPKRPVSAIRAD